MADLSFATPADIVTASTSATSGTSGLYSRADHTHYFDGGSTGGGGSGYVPTTRTLTAGAGLTGGGDLSANRTFDVGAGTLITVNADDVQVSAGANYQFVGTGAGTAPGWRNVSELAGAGLTAALGVLAVGAGAGITVNADDVALTTPGTLTVSTTNVAAGNHTHTITSSSNPGAAASILASDASGYLQLVRLGIGIAPTTALSFAAGSVIDFGSGDVTITHAANNLEIAGGNVQFDADIMAADGVAALGSPGGPTKRFAGLYLSSGAPINWSSGDVTITHSANTLTWAGATSGYVFNDGNISLDGDLSFVGAQSIATTAGNLTLAPTNDLILDPTNNNVLPNTNYDINIGSLTKKYLTLHAAELWVETLVAQNTIATIGGRILVGPTTTLTRDLTAGATTIYVKHNEMASGDRAYFEANGSVEFISIDSAPTLEGAGDYSYTITRNLDGSGANAWYAGDALFNLGTTGDGFIDLYSLRSVKSATQYGPSIVGNVRNSATYNDWTENWAIGNLNGVYGYSATTMGFAAGKYSTTTSWISADATNGFRINRGSTVLGQWNVGGDLKIGTDISAAATTNLVVFNSNQTYNTESVEAGDLLLGDNSASKANILWDKSAGILYFRSGQTAQVSVNTSGQLSAGGGTVLLDSNGVTIDGTLERCKWTSSATDLQMDMSILPLGSFNIQLKKYTTPFTVYALIDLSSSGVQIQGNLYPNVNDGYSLGTGTVSWSDLHIASGGIIGFANSDVTITHSANTLTFAGASSGYVFNDGSVGISTSPSHLLHAKSTQTAALTARIQAETANTGGRWSGIGFSGENANTKGGLLFESLGTSYSRMKLHLALNNAADATNVSISDAVVTIETGAVTLAANSSFTITGTCSVRLGTNPAATGPLNFANNLGIYWRNAANSADVLGVKLNASNEVELGASLKLSSGFYGLGAAVAGHVESGSATCSGGTVNVTFANAFGLAPRVALGPRSQDRYAITAVSTTGFTLTSDNATGTAEWIAFGSG